MKTFRFLGKSFVIGLCIFLIFVILDMFNICNWVDIDPLLEPLKKELTK
jgi:hypothetical protein